VPRRRDGDRAAREVTEVDDIVTLFRFVDENKLLAMLPKCMFLEVLILCRLLVCLKGT